MKKKPETHGFRALGEWHGRRWQPQTEEALAKAYLVTFTSPAGQQVLQHLLDSVYCKIYEGVDSAPAVVLNARRSVVQEILENIDRAERPEKYEVQVHTEENYG